MRKIRDDLMEQVDALISKAGSVDTLTEAKANLQSKLDALTQSSNAIQSQLAAMTASRDDLQSKLDALPWDYDKLLDICNKINASSAIKKMLGL